MGIVNWKEMRVGDKVIFRGFSNLDHQHWSFTKGKTYTVGKNIYGMVGPMSDNNGEIPSQNWGFVFEKVVDKTLEIDFSTLKKGDQLVFRGYSHQSPCFDYTVGKTYTVNHDGMGPPSDNVTRPWENYGFLFERVIGENPKNCLKGSHKENTVRTLKHHLRA